MCNKYIVIVQKYMSKGFHVVGGAKTYEEALKLAESRAKTTREETTVLEAQITVVPEIKLYHLPVTI